MTISTKIIIIVSGILLCTVLSFIVYKEIETSKKQSDIQNSVIQQQQLLDNITRSSSQYATSTQIDALITQSGLSLKVIQDDLNKLHAQIGSVNTITLSSKGQNATNISSTHTGTINPTPIPSSTPDPFGYLSKSQVLDLNESFSPENIPIGNVSFSAWQKAPWSIDILPRTYKITSVIATNENEKDVIENKVIINVNNKDYAVKIDKAETIQTYPDAKFTFWNPRLLMNLNGLVNIKKVTGDLSPGLGLSIMSYGKSLISPDLSVLQLGVSYDTVDKAAAVSLTPIAYNIGKLIPGKIIQSTFVGPNLQVNTNGNWLVGAGISVGF